MDICAKSPKMLAAVCLPFWLPAGGFGFFKKKSAAPQALAGGAGRPAGCAARAACGLQRESTEEVQQLLIFIFLRELSAAQKFLRK
jgi:hypothetical protein